MKIYSFCTGSVIEEEDFDFSFLDCNVDDAFLSMYFTRMKKYHYEPTNKTKIISEISGTTAKPFAQKGTGNARQGSRRAAQHRGGSTMFGPRGLKRAISIPKKEVSLAKKALFLRALQSSKLFVLSDCSVESHKTKFTLGCLQHFPGKRHIIVHDNEIENNNLLAIRNIPNSRYVNPHTFTVYDLISTDTILVTKKSIKSLSIALHV